MSNIFIVDLLICILQLAIMKEQLKHRTALLLSLQFCIQTIIRTSFDLFSLTNPDTVSIDSSCQCSFPCSINSELTRQE